MATRRERGRGSGRSFPGHAEDSLPRAFRGLFVAALFSAAYHASARRPKVSGRFADFAITASALYRRLSATACRNYHFTSISIFLMIESLSRYRGPATANSKKLLLDERAAPTAFNSAAQTRLDIGEGACR